MSPSSDIFLALCARKLSGDASAQDEQRLAVLLQDAACHQRYTQLKERWDSLSFPAGPSFDAQQAYAHLAPRLDLDVALPRATKRGTFFRQPRAWLLAATSAAAAAALLLWSAARQRSIDASPEAFVVQSVPPGSQAQRVLLDGTRVTLNAGSTLSYKRGFGHTHRVLTLSGQAYFEVTHDARQPFVVETGGLRTTVLGTKFNVSAYPGETAATIALVEGRVEVRPLQPSTPPIVLSPGQQVTLDNASGQSRVETMDSDVALGWMAGALVFHGTPLSDAVKTLERRFGVPIEIADAALAAHTLNARFQKESLSEILEILSFTSALQYTVEREQTDEAEARTESTAIKRVRLISRRYMKR